MTRDLRPRAVRTLRKQPPPRGIYASKYHPAIGVMICSRLAAGESLASICRNDPSMPTEKTVWNWARAHPEFARWRAWALETARARAMAAHAERAAARRARLAGPMGRRAWNRGRSGYGPEVVEAICDRLCLGEPLYIVCRDPAMPSIGTVYNWLRAHPEFVEAYRHAKQVAFDFIVDMAAETAPWLETEARSMRSLKRIVKRAHGRCGKLAPRQFAAGVYGSER